MMLPPDHGTKISFLFDKIKNFFSFISSFYDHEMLKKYQEPAFKIMFYEFIEAGIFNITKNLDTMVIYFENIIKNLIKFYKTVGSNEYENNNIHLIQVCYNLSFFSSYIVPPDLFPYRTSLYKF